MLSHAREIGDIIITGAYATPITQTDFGKPTALPGARAYKRKKPLFDSEPSPHYIQPRFWSKQSPIPNSNITRPSAYKGNSDRRV